MFFGVLVGYFTNISLDVLVFKNYGNFKMRVDVQLVSRLEGNLQQRLNFNMRLIKVFLVFGVSLK